MCDDQRGPALAAAAAASTSSAAASTSYGAVRRATATCALRHTARSPAPLAHRTACSDVLRATPLAHGPWPEEARGPVAPSPWPEESRGRARVEDVRGVGLSRHRALRAERPRRGKERKRHAASLGAAGAGGRSLWAGARGQGPGDASLGAERGRLWTALVTALAARPASMGARLWALHFHRLRRQREHCCCCCYCCCGRRWRSC